MTRQTTQKKAPTALPMSAVDALAFVLNGRSIDYAGLAKVGDVISGKPVDSRSMPA